MKIDSAGSLAIEDGKDENFMSGLKNFPLQHAIVLFTSLVLALSLTYNIDRTDVSAKSQQIEKEGRQLENDIPKHVPLRVKIKREKESEFRDLTNEKWARDFELEVTNK